MRTVSIAALNSLFAEHSGEVWIELLTVTHPAIPVTAYFPAGVLRFTNCGADVTSRGQVFKQWPYQLGLPDQRGDALPRPQLEIAAVDLAVITALRTITTPPTITFEVVLDSTPDTVEAGPIEYTLEGVQYNVATVRGTLAHENVMSEAAPGYRFTPQHFPGLF